MSEQRLIDANCLIDDLAAAKENCGMGKVVANTLMRYVKKQITIAPETLPIVQELRKELERVKEDRDAAIADLYYACACETCELQYTDKCPLKKGMVPCSHIASALRNNTMYKWRGIQEAQEDE